MRTRHWAIGALLATVVANTGCVTCCHKSHQKALEHGPDCELPAPCRSQVYVFLINGLTPSTQCGLGALRIKLAENGFAKVGIADLAGGFCVEHEIKKIRACEPDAKFVLVGYDVGGPVAVCAARDLISKGIAVEAVILLDPVGCKEAHGAPTLVITSGKGSCTVPHGRRVVVPDAGHFTLPAHPTTVAAITDLLREIAINGYEPVGDPVPEWTYPHAPEMRAQPTGRWSAEWDFLADHGPTRPIGASTAQPTATPTVPTSAGAVLLRK